MLPMLRKSKLALCVFVLLIAPGSARSDEPGDGFAAFCTKWMQKLAVREQANAKAAELRTLGGEVVVEYTGYAREPGRCESRVKRPGSPGVGVLVYHELRYRGSGADAKAARGAEPSVLERIEVTEVFRYDGRRWSY
jgi:hypothetical protein